MLNSNIELTERRLKSIRVLYGLKQSELAAHIGRSQTRLSFVESGKLLPQPEEARKIAEILKAYER
jgi:DNA-binding XRE family transcriptional regulator